MHVAQTLPAGRQALGLHIIFIEIKRKSEIFPQNQRIIYRMATSIVKTERPHNFAFRPRAISSAPGNLLWARKTIFQTSDPTEFRRARDILLKKNDLETIERYFSRSTDTANIALSNRPSNEFLPTIGGEISDQNGRNIRFSLEGNHNSKLDFSQEHTDKIKAIFQSLVKLSFFMHEPFILFKVVTFCFQDNGYPGSADGAIELGILNPFLIHCVIHELGHKIIMD
jgi:hypothetical protein